MSYVNSDIQINGSPTQLDDFSENYAVIQNAGFDFNIGDACQLTLFLNLMERRVPVTLKGEVVRQYDGKLDVMFSSPTFNWQHIVRALKRSKPLSAAS